MDNPQRILIIQLKRAGDVLLTTPAAAVVKRRWPQAKVDFLVDKAFETLLENNPAIDTVRPYDRNRMGETLRQIRAQKYDMVFDFQSSPRSAIAAWISGAPITSGFRVPFWGHVYKHTVPRPGDDRTVVEGKLSLLKSLVGDIHETPPTRLVLTEDERQWAQDFRKGSSRQTVIGLVPTHRRASRRWQGASFAALARRLEKAGYGCWLFWGPGEREVVEGIHQAVPSARLIPPASLRQMAALFSCCDGVVTNDNGPMHLAVAVGAPTVTLYGPTHPGAWNPGGPRHTVLQAEGLTCLGCNLNECPFGHECMQRITPDSAFRACQELLTRANKLCSVR